MQILIAILY